MPVIARVIPVNIQEKKKKRINQHNSQDFPFYNSINSVLVMC